MRLPRLPQQRPIGHIIERGVKEILGPQSGRNYLYQHTPVALVGAMPKDKTHTVGIALPTQPGDAVNLAGKFFYGFSTYGGTDEF